MIIHLINVNVRPLSVRPSAMVIHYPQNPGGKLSEGKGKVFELNLVFTYLSLSLRLNLRLNLSFPLVFP